MIIKINKIGDRFFFTKSGKEWDVQAMMEDILEEGTNIIKIEIIQPERKHSDYCRDTELCGFHKEN